MSVQVTGWGATEPIIPESREVSVVTDFEDRQVVSVHPKHQLHEGRDFCLMCILLRVLASQSMCNK